VPTYAYACTACDHRFETVQSFQDSSLTECPVCGGRLRKLFNNVGVVFKGSGFYRTDSRSSATSSVSPSSSDASSGASSSSPSSGSSKPAAASGSSSGDTSGSAA
jgi:putative FmdB family regulatory protein